MERTFGIVPSSNGPLIFIVIVSIILLLIIGFFVVIGYSAKNMKFDVNDQGLRIRGGLYGRFIPKEEIISERAEILNLNISEQYKPKARTNGIGLPGYSAGWFKLKNNEKALLFVTDRSNVVYLPTSQGYSVLLSVDDAEGFYDSIKVWR